MNYKTLIVGSVFSFCLGAALVYYFLPQIKTVEKEVIRNNVVTVVKEVKRPDGTTETEITTTDKTVKHETSVAVTPPIQPNWRIGASAVAGVPSLKPIYGLQVERRVLGPVWIGVRVETNAQLGAVLSIEF